MNYETNPVVIPAKAGIQAFLEKPRAWIPGSSPRMTKIRRLLTHIAMGAAVFAFAFFGTLPSRANAQSGGTLLINGSPSGSFSVGSSWTLTLSGAPTGQPVSICATQTVPMGTTIARGCTPMGTSTDTNGNWSLSGSFSARGCGAPMDSCLGSWTQYVSVGGALSSSISFTVNGSLSLFISGGGFRVGDNWTLSISSNLPNYTVYICAIHPNGVQDCNAGPVLPNPGPATTNGSGSWSSSGTFSTGELGAWREWAELEVDGIRVIKSNDINFTVVSACTGCLITSVCQPPGTQNPANTCQVCDPARSTTNWSLQSGSHFECQTNACVSIPNTTASCTNQSGCFASGAPCNCAVSFNQPCNTNANCGGRFTCDGVTCAGGVNCGTNFCSGGVCQTTCTPESNQQFCTRLGKNCGQFSSTDNCNAPRTVADCSFGVGCSGGQMCGGSGVPNVCGTGTCTPDCTGRVCGPDPVCGQACSPGCNASAGEGCTAAGQCVPFCVPNCTNKQCGDDGCGTSCGTCTIAGETCGGGGVPNICGGGPAGAAPTVPKIIFGRAAIPNPLAAQSFKEFIVLLVSFFVFLGILLAAIMIVVSGIRMIAAVGNATKLAAAKSTLTWAVIGFMLLLIAMVFVLLVADFVGVGSPIGWRITGGGGGGGGGQLYSCGAKFCGPDQAACTRACNGPCNTASQCFVCGVTYCGSDQAVCTSACNGPCNTSTGCDLSGTTPPPGSAPMLFIDMTINGDGAQSTVSAAAAPFDGFYTPPLLDNGEYIAKLLDANSQTLFLHGFNSPNAKSGEVEDASGGLDTTRSGGIDISSLQNAIIIPALPGSKTLEITNAAGVTIAAQQVAAAVEESHRQFALRHGITPTREWFAKFAAPEKAMAAGGVWKIAVVGANYTSKTAFDADWQAFESRLRATDPYTRVSGAIQIIPVYKSATVPAFTPTELGCSTRLSDGRDISGKCGGYWCQSPGVLGNTAAVDSFDNVVVFVGGQPGGGCADVDFYKGNMRFATVNSNGNADHSGRVAVHEISHAFGALIDEYTFINPSDPQQRNSKWFSMAESDFNCDRFSNCPKWQGMAGTSCTPGCVTSGHFRSIPNSLMTSAMYSQTLPFQYGPYNIVLIEKQLARLGISVGTPTGDTEPPTVVITDPLPGTVKSGTTRLWAIATDNVGVVQVEFFANGASIGVGTRQVAYDQKAFNINWDTTAVSNGLYDLLAKAKDTTTPPNIGQSQIVKVSVSNGGVVVTPLPTQPPGPCGTASDGLQIICVNASGSHTAQGTINYGSGFPTGLPAMGMGAPNLGYIPISYPFTCAATDGTLSVSVNNTAGGKICEVIFNNAIPGTGDATYTITADANAPKGDYIFGLNANAGATVAEPSFYIRVQ